MRCGSRKEHYPAACPTLVESLHLADKQTVKPYRVSESDARTGVGGELRRLGKRAAPRGASRRSRTLAFRRIQTDRADAERKAGGASLAERSSGRGPSRLDALRWPCQSGQRLGRAFDCQPGLANANRAAVGGRAVALSTRGRPF